MYRIANIVSTILYIGAVRATKNGGCTQPQGVGAAGRFMETIDQSSVIGTTSATVNP
jgi:hypothetical protein